MSNKNELSGTADPHRRIDFLVGFMNKMVRRIDLLENARDEKVEPVSPSIEWYAHQHHQLSRENELLKHDIQCFKDDYANGHKIRMDLTNKLIKERDDLLKTVDDKQKVLEMTMDQRDEYGKTLIRLKNETARCKGLFDQLVKENQRLEEDVRGAHEKVKELEKLIEDYKVGAMGIRKRILELEDDNKEQSNLIKLYEAANADMAEKIKELEKMLSDAHEKVKELDQPYAPKFTDYIDALASIGKKCKEIDELNKRLDFFEKMSYDLEMEKKDAKWYREQAINKCIDIVELIKNDPLTSGDGICKNWMVAICEDIQKAIKNEFGVK